MTGWPPGVPSTSFASRLVAGTKKESEWTALIIFCLVGFGVVATNLLSTTCLSLPVLQWDCERGWFQHGQVHVHVWMMNDGR